MIKHTNTDKEIQQLVNHTKMMQRIKRIRKIIFKFNSVDEIANAQAFSLLRLELIRIRNKKGIEKANKKYCELLTRLSDYQFNVHDFHNKCIIGQPPKYGDVIVIITIIELTNNELDQTLVTDARFRRNTIDYVLKLNESRDCF